jgi:16S rRNA (uracil1498-N3)-methyltransferase
MRLHVDGPLQAETAYTLPPGPTRHAQVRRVQPGDELTLFDGQGCDWPARVLKVGRSAVDVWLGAPQVIDRELPQPVSLALGMPANERMDSLVEKATELGVARLQPLLCERAVLRLEGERAERRRAHWQAVAVAACEQSGRARVPPVQPVQALAAWLAALPPLAPTPAPAPAGAARLVLSLRADALPLAQLPAPAQAGPVLALSGPEGGLSPAEEDAARAAGFTPVSLGPRTLRADTAPLALLAWFALGRNGPQAG